MNFSPFSCPIFLGHPEARGCCSQGERVLYGRDLCCSGGAEKAETAKLPGAGWYTWQGDCIEGKGVEPDMLVENSPESLASGADLQLEKALESVKSV